MLDELLKTYCKLKQIDLQTTNNLHRLHKNNFTICNIIVTKDMVIVNQEDIKEESKVEDFRTYLEKEIDLLKFIRRTSMKCKPTWPIQYVHMKLIEYGKKYCKEYGRRQTRRLADGYYKEAII